MPNVSIQPAKHQDLTSRYWRPPTPYIDSPPAAATPSGLGIAYWRAAQRNWRALLLIVFLGPAIGAAVYLLQTPIYQARTSIEIRNLNDAFMNTAPVSPVAEGGGAVSPSDMATQVRLLQSPGLLETVAARLRTREHAAPTAGVPATVRRALGLSAPDPTLDVEPKTAAKNLRVRPGGQTRIVDIQFDSTSPQLAADFANTLTAAFIDASLDARLDAAQKTSEWLNKQLAELRAQLERSDNALQAYARETGLLFTSDTSSVSEDKLRQLQEELSRAQADRLAKQARAELSTATTADGLPEASNSSLQALREQITELRRKRAEAITTYTENHSSVKKLDSQLAPLEEAARAEQERVVNRIRNDYDGAVRRETLLSSRFAEQSRLVTDEADKSVKYHILQRQVASNQQLYDTMLQRSKEVAMSAALRATAVRVIDPARVPDAPYLPNLPLNLALGLVPALCLALAFTSMRARTDRGLHGPGHAAALLNVAELGVIPRATAGEGWRVKSAGVRPRLSSGTRALRRGGVATVIDLVADAPSEDTILQSFRGVVTSIMAGDPGERPTALVITSFNPGEGKTTVTGNLAAVLAETGARVLVIDADLHSPRIHEVFGLPNARGLTTLLAMEHAPSVDRLKECVQPTPVPRVFALTAGPRHSLGSGLLYSRALAPLLDVCRQHFDMVLIDSPPMLQIPDARLLGRVADGIVLVARAERTTTDEVLAVRQRLIADGTPVLGTILNAWHSSRGGYYQFRLLPGEPVLAPLMEWIFIAAAAIPALLAVAALWRYPEYGLLLYGVALGFPDVVLPLGAINLRIEDGLVAFYALRLMLLPFAPFSPGQRRILTWQLALAGVCLLSALTAVVRGYDQYLPVCPDEAHRLRRRRGRAAGHHRLAPAVAVPRRWPDGGWRGARGADGDRAARRRTGVDRHLPGSQVFRHSDELESQHARTGGDVADVCRRRRRRDGIGATLCQSHVLRARQPVCRDPVRDLLTRRRPGPGRRVRHLHCLDGPAEGARRRGGNDRCRRHLLPRHLAARRRRRHAHRRQYRRGAERAVRTLDVRAGRHPRAAAARVRVRPGARGVRRRVRVCPGAQLVLVGVD